MKQTFNFLLMFVMVATVLSSCGKKDVTPLPTADFTFTPDTGRAWITVTFTNTSINATTYAWDFGGGATASTEKSPIIRFTGGGTFVITLTATGDGGVTKITKNITLLPPTVVGKYLITENTLTTGIATVNYLLNIPPCFLDDIAEFRTDGSITTTDVGTVCTVPRIFNPTTYTLSANGKTLTFSSVDNGVTSTDIWAVDELTNSVVKISAISTNNNGFTTTQRITYTKI